MTELWEVYYIFCLICSIGIATAFILTVNGLMRFGMIVFFIGTSISISARLFFTDLVEPHKLNEISIIPTAIGFGIAFISVIPFLYKTLIKRK